MKHLVIQYPTQKSKVTHATVEKMMTTAIGGFMIHYTTYMLYFILMYSCIHVLKFTPVYVIPKVPIFSIFAQNKPIITVVFRIGVYI